MANNDGWEDDNEGGWQDEPASPTLGLVPNPNEQAHEQTASIVKQNPLEEEANPSTEQGIRRKEGMSLAIPETMLSLGPAMGGLAKAPLATIGKLATSAGTGILGAGLGRFGARELGFGQTGQDVAAAGGGLLGSVAGYREPPARIGWRGIGVNVPESFRPAGAARAAEEAVGSFMNRGYKPVVAPPQSERSPLSGMSSTAPAEVGALPQRAILPTGDEAPVTTGRNAVIIPKGATAEEGIKGAVAKPSGRLVLTPQEQAAQEQMQRIATKRASEHGMQYAAGMRPAGGGRVPFTPTGTQTFEYPPAMSNMKWDEETQSWVEK